MAIWFAPPVAWRAASGVDGLTVLEFASRIQAVHGPRHWRPVAGGWVACTGGYGTWEERGAVDQKLLNSLEWRLVGPHRGGRVVAVAGHPTKRETFYMGACAGGVWKTTSAGALWENISDGFFKTSAVGAITAHLVHGLSSPLSGLQEFMVSRASDDGPEPAMNKWFSAGYDFICASARAPIARRHAAKSSIVTW